MSTSSTVSTSGVTVHEPTMTTTTTSKLSPAHSPVNRSTPSPRPESSHSPGLQAQVESERAEVVSALQSQHHDQFEKVDSLSQQLENTVSNAMDIFKREPQAVVAGKPEGMGEGKEDGVGETASSTTPTTKPESHSIPSVTTTASPSVAKTSFSSPAAVKAKSPTVVTEDREGGPFLRGVEKDTTIAPTASPLSFAPSSASPSASSRDLQIASLSLSLIQAKQAYTELVDKLYSSNIGSSLIGADIRPVTSPSPSSLLSSLNPDDLSLSSFLHSLPVLKGWVTVKQPGTANVPPSYLRKYVAVSFDGLILSDDESGTGGVQKVDLSRYWLIERTKDKMASGANYAASAAAAPSTAAAAAAAAAAAPFPSLLSPVAGKSVFRFENGAYVLRLVPIITDAEHPQTVLEPSVSQIIELTGATEEDIAKPDMLSKWVDAINLRISILSLLATPNHGNLLARGGREVVAFLCSLDSRTLLIENKYVDVAAIFSFFKEPLIHRHDFSLSLRNVALDDGGVKVLSELLVLNQTIHHLDLSCNAITAVGASYLAASLEVNQLLPSLRLDFNTEMTDEGLMEIVSALAPSSALTSLGLRGCKVGDGLLQSMVETLRGGVGKVWSLLDFSWNELTDASADSVGVLVSAFSVASLILSHNRYGDHLMSAIDSSLSSSSSSQATLALLDVSYNGLTSASASSITSLLASCQSLSVKLSGNRLSPSTLIALLSSPTALSVEELRITRVNTTAGNPPPLKKRLSIMKETAKGKVELIDPLHPRSEKDLGRGLEEVSPESKTNTVTDGAPLRGPAIAGGEEKDVLDVPATAAATELLVDGGKTADPRHLPPSRPSAPTVDTRSTDPHSLEMEAEAAAEAARARVYARAGRPLHGDRKADSPAHPPPALSASGLVPMTPQQMEAQKRDCIVKGMYPQADLSTV